MKTYLSILLVSFLLFACHETADKQAGQFTVDSLALKQAQAHGLLVNEGLERCRRFVDDWLLQADSTTGLIPRNLDEGTDIWNAKDAAADNYPFMVLTASLTELNS